MRRPRTRQTFSSTSLHRHGLRQASSPTCWAPEGRVWCRRSEDGGPPHRHRLRHRDVLHALAREARPRCRSTAGSRHPDRLRRVDRNENDSVHRAIRGAVSYGLRLHLRETQLNLSNQSYPPDDPATECSDRRSSRCSSEWSWVMSFPARADTRGASSRPIH